MKKIHKRFRNDLANYIKFYRLANIRTPLLILSAVASLMATLFEAAFVVALVPFVRGVLSGDFLFVSSLPVFGRIISFFPNNSQPNTLSFMMLLSVLVVSVIFKTFLKYISFLLICYQLRNSTSSIRKAIFERYLLFGKLFFDRNDMGRIQSVLLNFIDMITIQFSNLNAFFSSFFMLIMYVVIMFIISSKLTLLILIVFPFLTYLLARLVNKIKKSSVYYADFYGVLSKKISSTLSCLPLVRLYVNQRNENKNFSSASDRLEKVGFSIDKKRHLIGPVQEFAFLIMIVILVIAMSYMMFKQKEGSIASFVVFFYLLRRAQANTDIVNKMRVLIASVGGQISQVLNMFDDKDKFIVPSGKLEFPGFFEKIEFKNIEFSYIPDYPVIKGISFTVEKNQTTAIVGPTGSGKTTLVSLFLRFYDSRPGEILIDGSDIRSFSIDSLMSCFSYVGQDALLFNDTIRNNIIYGLDRDVPEHKLIEVSKQARLFDFIMSLPARFDTYVGDRGVILSGGEKQRVSIVRALLKEADILIMDEATSSLDSKTERLIQEAINAAIKGKTAIIIAHRLSTIKHVDKIIVIDGGRLIEEGSLDLLLKKKGRFYEYWQEQNFY